MADPVGRIGGATASAVRASRSTIDITEPALEIGFLAGHYAVTDDEREGHQHHQLSEIVERDGQADQTQERAEVDGVAREAVRSALDDGGGRQVGGDARTGPGDMDWTTYLEEWSSVAKSSWARSSARSCFLDPK